MGMTPLREVYSGRRVFATGHTGFKGSWLTLWLSELGAEVTGYSLDPPTSPNLFEAIGLESRIRHLTGDVTDTDRLAEALHTAQPEVVFHLAAQSLVPVSYSEPVSTFASNVMGTVNLLEAVRHTDTVKACVIVTSDKCYENHEWVYGYRENDPMGGHDPYSASKGCAELVSASYRRSFFEADKGAGHRMPGIATARAGNVIGGGDWATARILPDCARALSSGETIVLRNPHAVRPWQYVLEPLGGYLQLGAHLLHDPARYSQAWNFGPAESRFFSVAEVVELAVSAWGSGRYEADGGTHPHEAGMLTLDISKAVTELGWRPRYGTVEAVERTVKWYKTFYSGGGAGTTLDFTVSEIKEYEEAMGTTSSAP